jgi:hypothetical protein
MGQDFVDLDSGINVNAMNALLGAYARVGPPDPADTANPTSNRFEISEQSNGEFRVPFFKGGKLDKTASRP